MKHLSIIGTVGVPACYGGFETLVENLLDDNEKDKDITVYCSSKSYSEKISSYKNAKLHYIPLNANGATAPLHKVFRMIFGRYAMPYGKVQIMFYC